MSDQHPMDFDELDYPLHLTTDATLWATEFCNRFIVFRNKANDTQIEDQVGLMTTWFANVPETGHTAGDRSTGSGGP